MGNYGPIITFLLGVISILLGVMVAQFRSLGEKMETKVSTASCEEYRELNDKTLCRASDEWKRHTENMWSAINKHSHTTLADNARVIR